MPDGSLLVVSMKQQRLLRRSPSGEVSIHAELAGHCGGHLNDMVVDAHGRAYVGEFGFDLQAFADPAAREADAGRSRRRDHGCWRTTCCSRTARSSPPDGTTLIVGETAGARYTAFTLAADGSVRERRIWAQLGDTPELGPLAETLPKLGFAPDGCTLDADGAIWAADAVGARCARILEGGEIVEEIAAPEGLGIYACMLGGEDGRTLLMCAAPDFLEVNRAPRRDAVLLTTSVEVPHAGLP